MRIRQRPGPALRPSGFDSGRHRSDGWLETADVVDLGTYYEVRISVRGIDPDRLRVEVRDEVVVVTGRRNYSDSVDSGPVFQRVVGLPSDAARAGATARLDADRVVVRIPRARPSAEASIDLDRASERVAGV